jgi:hypothetical protein
MSKYIAFLPDIADHHAILALIFRMKQAQETGETVMVAHVFRPVHLIFSPENWKSSDQLLTVEAIETNIRYLVSASQCIVLSSSVNNHKSMHVGYHANLKYLFIAVYL